ISPSVTRAATMFSFVIIGSTLNKHTNVYNTLCVSAFFLLLFQPQSLFNVGFLLSYTAVFGIVYLYPRIYGIWNVRNWFLDKVWVLLSVSLAAQIATFPLSLHYFHQFPNYFLVANVIVVPLATCVIYMALVLFALMPVELVARPIASGISHLVDMLNYFVRWIENLPYAVTDGIEIGTGEVVLIYLLIVLSVFYLQTRKYQYLISLVCLVSILAVNQVVQDVSRNKQIKLIVYDTPGQSAFDVIQGTSSLLAADSAVLTNSKTIHFVMENNWRQMGIREKLNRTTEGAQQDGLPALISVLNGARILFPLTVPEQNENNRVKVDILILSKRCKSSVQKLSEIFDIGEIVFDASIRPYKLEQFTKACTRLSIPYYSVVKSGAFVRDF
ncbi:MAG: ComEC/Rec2 family competence protein, partial [Flavobacteriales bacterium]|nr:ComEC/Rec2 family competence protein [Flavobacteriales bacterium]